MDGPATSTAPNSYDEFFMPFTANRQFKKAPRLLVSAKDMHYTSHDGRSILDSAAGLWCVNAGHCRPKIAEAIARQAGTMDFAPMFQMAHPQAFELASRVARMLPDGLEHVFFSNSGSEAVDTALKIALAYHRARGEGQRTRLIGRERGYHGVGFGGISVGGIGNNRKQFGTMLAGVDHLPHTHDIARNAFSRGQPAHGAELADNLERLVALHDASTIAAVIVEPMAGSTGVLIPPVGYLERLKSICAKHGILLIFDEVISGFGRLGSPFATDLFGITPDILTLAKGITNATVPMGATVISPAIYDAFMQGPEGSIELFHGYTYSAHVLACAAALATLDTYEEEGIFENAAALSPYFEDAVHSLKGHPHVIDVRNLGMVAGVELAPRPGAVGARAYDVFVACYNAGLLTRVTGDIIAISPPLIAQKKHIDEMVGIIGDVLKTVN
jgi:beta-alanine--pyruvate transaminase